MLIHYFAFGSNMARARLLARIPNAAPLGRGRLDGWRFACNKKGHDGSAKANIHRDPSGAVWGVVYRMPRSQLPRLDAFEGGYERTRVHVVELAHPSGRVHCETYFSERLLESGSVFDWYKRHMVVGAREHALPDPWVAMLEALPDRPSR
ncbi:MAG: gamma-glutamylcyclotransferase family protein [Polyangiaceae bacterium]